MSKARGRLPSEWMQGLESPSADDWQTLRQTYGTNDTILRERAAVLLRTLRAYVGTFGDDHPVRIFRAPGRINLRGMHVDLHGGWLNLMTHQRETVVVAAETGSRGTVDVRNAEANHQPVPGTRPLRDPESDWKTWADGVRQTLGAPATQGWAPYVWGALLRSQGNGPPPGLRAMVYGDLPQGSSLSSSASLILALLLTGWGFGTKPETDEEQLIAAQDAEWFAGACVGLSDQTAILLGRTGSLLSLPIDPNRFDTATATYRDWPDGLDVLVIDSGIHRSLRGAAREAYVASRFSYSMAIRVLQGAMAEKGFDALAIDAAGRLSTIMEAFGAAPAGPFYALLGHIPEFATLDYLRNLIGSESVDHAWSTFFPDDPPDETRRWPLRGPLLFGVAESERARVFPLLIDKGDWAAAGRLMTAGHDGDRISWANAPATADDAAVARWTAAKTPVEHLPGVFAASTPVLDGIVDTALSAGALGASLTGAGLGGSVVALCRATETEAVSHAVHGYFASDTYRAAVDDAASAGPPSIVTNAATLGAGELIL